MKPAVGILLTNTGTPDSPSVESVKAYLKAFLSDPRVVRFPKILWKPLLHGLILPSRAPRSAKLYQKIWTPAGSPLRSTMLALAQALETELSSQFKRPIYVETGMHYGSPSIPDALSALRAKNIEQLIALPLFPQYSTTTTEAARDQLQTTFDDANSLQSFFISHYSEHPSYISALVNQIRKHHLPERHLLFSFHGLPQVFAEQGDPYPDQCRRTTQLLAQALDLPEGSWTLAYQSRLGYAKWLSPYTFETLQQLARKGVREVSVFCPGFSVDCLETLEEIKIRGKEVFLKEGGEVLDYIPALNAQEAHVKALAEIVKEVEVLN